MHGHFDFLVVRECLKRMVLVPGSDQFKQIDDVFLLCFPQRDVITLGEINMEPKNHPFTKENPFPHLHSYVP